MPTQLGAQRITLFQDDDVTPLSGTPTCGTAATETRPYMKQILETAESEINFKEGKAVIGQINVEILDKRRTANDQKTGWFTQLLSDGKNTQILGRRCLVEQQASNGTWYTLLNGVVSSCMLDETLVTYRLELRDMRERERNQRIFVHNNHGIVPWGPISGYGKIKSSNTGGTADFVVPPFGGIEAIYKSATKQFLLWKPYEIDDTLWALMQPFMFGVTGYTAYGSYNKLIQVELRWTSWQDKYQWYGASDYYPLSWTTLADMNLMGPPERPLLEWKDVGSKLRGFQRAITAVNVDTSAGTMPSNNQACWLHVVSRALPTKEAPIYITTNFGQLLKDIYDGDYSDADAPLIPYDSAAMSAMIADTPYCNAVIEAPVDDRRTWVEENIYKPLGYAPALTTDGKVAPIKYSIPDATVTLLQLDDTNLKSATWSHDTSEVVTKVNFTYQRDITTFMQGWSASNGITITSREVIHERISADTTVFGEKLLDYKPVTVRSVTNNQNGTAIGGDAASELGAKLAEARSLDAINRFSQGAQRLEVEAFRGATGVSSLKVGDWVIIAATWLPDYVSQVRGINRIAQVIKIKDQDPLLRAMTLLDGGPYGQPLTNATVTGITANNTTGRVEANVAAIPTVTGVTVKVELQVAVTPTVPVTGENGKYELMAVTSATGVVQSDYMAPGAICWVRYRTVAEGMRPSAWSVPVDVTFTDLPQLKNPAVTVDGDTDKPVVTWLDTHDCVGVRIEYLIQGPDLDAPTSFATSVDVDGSLKTATIDVVVPDGNMVYVRLTPYSAYSAGVCSGTAGRASLIVAAVNETNLAYNTVTATIIDYTATKVTIQVDNIPPSAQVKLLTLTGATIDTGAAVGTLVDSGEQWVFNRPLATADDGVATFRAILSGLADDDDVIVIPAQGKDVIPLKVVAKAITVNATQVVVRVQVYTAFEAISTSLTYDSHDEDGALVITPGSPQTVAATTDIGTTGYVDFTITRPAIGKGPGRAVFTATATGRIWDSDPIDIPAQTLVYNQCAARVTNVTATTITITVSGSNGVTTPTVGLVSIGGTATLNSGHAAGVYTYAQNGTDNVWVFNRGPALGGSGQVQFRAVTTSGTQSDDDFVTIPEQGRDTTYMVTRARVTASSATTVTVRVAVADPYPQGANSASIAHSYIISSGAGTVDKTSPQLCTPASTLTEAAGTYVDYVVTRPAFGTGTGRITFTVTDVPGNRVSDSDAVDIPAIEQDTIYCECRATVTNVSATQIEVTVTAVSTLGTPTVGLVGITGSASLASGHAAGVYTYAQNGTDNKWLFNRGAFQTGMGQVQFRAVFTGTQSDDDFVSIADQGRDTVPLVMRARVVATAATTVTVRVAVADPYPQGTNSVSIAHVYTISTGSGTVDLTSPQLVTPAASITEGANTFKDYVVTRPPAGTGSGRITFTATDGGNRISDSDAVDVPAIDSAGTTYVQCKAAVTGVSATQITVTVSADVVSGTPTVGYVGVTNATKTAGHTAGTYTYAVNGTDNVWTFTRPAFGTGSGQAQFRAICTGSESDDAFIDIPEIGRDTIFLTARARITAITATQATIRVAVVDPYPQGTNSATIRHKYTINSGDGTVDKTSPQTCTPEATFSTTFPEAAGTYVDYVVNRPAFGAGNGRITFTVEASNRVMATDAVDVQAQEKTSFGPSLTVTPTQYTTYYDISFTYSGTITLTIDGGSPTTPSSPITNIARNAAGGAAKTYVFACVADSQTISATVVIPPQESTAGTDKISGVYANNAFFPNDGGGYFDVHWNSSITPALVDHFDVTYHISAGNYPGAPTDVTETYVTNGDTLNHAFASAPSGSIVVKAIDANGDVIATGTMNDAAFAY